MRVIVMILLVAAIPIAGQTTLRSPYPFLAVGPLRPPDTLYHPTWIPPSAHPVGLRLQSRAFGVDMEWTMADETHELVIWETTRVDTNVDEAVGAHEDEQARDGRLARWRTAHTSGGRNVLYARVGVTLVVIAGGFAIEDLLRVADSLRPITPSALML